MDKFQDKTVYCNFAITEQTGGTGADLHTTAIKNADGNYVLNGANWLISHTDCPEYPYILAVPTTAAPPWPQGSSESRYGARREWSPRCPRAVATS